MGVSVRLDQALRDSRRFLLDSGIFAVERLTGPGALDLLDRSRLFTTFATLVECLHDRAPVVRTFEANIRRRAQVLPPSEAIAHRALGIFKEIRPLREDGPGVADVYIAAAAIEHGLVVVTHDRGHFAQFDVEYLAKWT